MKLPDKECPNCNAKMTNDSIGYTEEIKAAHKYDDCLRKCHSCHIGYSNAADRPKIIFENYLDNIPEGISGSLEEVLEKSINKRNRKSKKIKIGFSTSEDALTWVVFRYFQKEDKLGIIIENIAESTSGTAEISYWGVGLKDDKAIQNKELKDVLDTLKENHSSYSEPDIILEDDNTVIFIEAKLNSKNIEKESPNQHKYYENTKHFKSDSDFKKCKEYQLIRNWRIGNDYAKNKNKKFYLINLVNNEVNTLDKFKGCIKTSENSIFKVKTWNDIRALLKPEPDWVKNWIDKRIGKNN